MKKYMPVVDVLFSAAPFLEVHYSARRQLEADLVDERKHGAERLSLWRTAYTGGEGLYGAYVDSKLPGCSLKQRIISEVNDEFRKLRAATYAKAAGQKVLDSEREGWRDRVDQVYESFATIAFQCGFAMTVDYMAQREFGGTWSRAAAEIAKRLSKVSLKEWLAFFGEFREWYVRAVDPNAWPKYRKMLLTVLGYGKFFRKGEKNAPIVFMVKARVRELCEATLDAGGSLGEKKMLSHVIATIEAARAVYEAVGARSPYTSTTLKKIGLQEAATVRSEYP